jgi:hypothetical protein
MSTYTGIADYEWLSGIEAGAVLEELAAEQTPLHTLVAQLRKRFTQTQTHLLLEQADLRRRATEKFTQTQRMFFTSLGLEQATDERIARYKADRIQRAVASTCTLIADLCCGIGGDLMPLAPTGWLGSSDQRAPGEPPETTTTAIGIDRDPIAALFAHLNTGAPAHTSDINTYDLAGVSAFHIDPDRRPTGKRTTSLEFCSPNRSEIEQLLAQVPNAAMKLAPACEVPDDWAARCELEWISRNRECRQLVAWHGNLATSPGHRRATIIPTACSLAPRTIVGQPKQPVRVAEKIERYIFDIDPAVLAAKLKGALAAEHQLAALSIGPTYLTGPKLIDDPALSTFEVDDVLNFDIRTLSQYLQARNIGILEIKKRGTDVDAENLRRTLKLRGNNAATLLITQVAGRATAVLAHRTSVC